MTPFNIEHFTRRLISEAIFYDEETGAFTNLSLIDMQNRRERYIAYFDPEAEAFMIEEATEWESPAEQDEEIGYAMAVDTQEHGQFDSEEAIADALLLLAREQGLMPSLALLYEDEDVA